MFLQLSLAFLYGPMSYLRKLFTPEQRLISAIYILSLALALYFGSSGAGYLPALGCVLMQGGALAFFVMQAIGGGQLAQSWGYTLMKSSLGF